MSYITDQFKANLTSVYENIAGMYPCDERNQLIDQFNILAKKLNQLRGQRINENTRLNYMYRDAGNWKCGNTVVLIGKMTDEQFEEMRKCCIDGYEQFVPEQLGLDLIREWETTIDDVPYAELDDYEVTHEYPTVDITVEELLEKFRNAKGNWHPEDYEPEISEEED